MDRILAALQNIDWELWHAPAISALRIVLIVAAAWIASVFLQRVVRGVRVRVANHIGGIDAARRAETLGRVIRYLIALVISAIAVMLVLAEVGISLAPILGAAGVVGLAIGFGAQSLVKDYFTGFFTSSRTRCAPGTWWRSPPSPGWSKTSRCDTCGFAVTTAMCISFRTTSSPR